MWAASYGAGQLGGGGGGWGSLLQSFWQTYTPHDGGVHDALLPARLHHSSLQAGDNITNMELDDTL